MKKGKFKYIVIIVNNMLEIKRHAVFLPVVNSQITTNDDIMKTFLIKSLFLYAFLSICLICITNANTDIQYAKADIPGYFAKLGPTNFIDVITINKEYIKHIVNVLA